MVTHFYNAHNGETETEDSWSLLASQPSLWSIKKPCLKKQGSKGTPLGFHMLTSHATAISSYTQTYMCSHKDVIVSMYKKRC